MKVSFRSYKSEDDYWRIRQFLREVYLLNGRRELSWQVYRLDYWRWHGAANITHARLEDVLGLWETADGQLAAVACPEGPGEAFFHVRPGFKSPELEQEMLVWAEGRLSGRVDENQHGLTIWANQYDVLRQEMLEWRGYSREGTPERQRFRVIGEALPEPRLENGYTIRALGGEEELPARSYASWRAFHPDESDDNYEGWEWYRNIQRIPQYRRDLDLVAVSPEGQIAGFCTIWFDDVTRTGAFEPVAVVPEHQRLGLGKALMFEGLRRIRKLGATQATVGSYGPIAGALYESAGFCNYDMAEPWYKAW